MIVCFFVGKDQKYAYFYHFFAIIINSVFILIFCVYCYSYDIGFRRIFVVNARGGENVLECLQFIFISILKMIYQWNGAIIIAISFFFGILGLVSDKILWKKKDLKSGKEKSEEEKQERLKRSRRSIRLLILVTGIGVIFGFLVEYVKAHYTFVPEIDFGNQSLQEVHSELDHAGLQYVDKFDKEAQNTRMKERIQQVIFSK